MFDIPLLRGGSHIDFCMQCIIMMLGGGEAITNDILKFRKLIEFQIHKSLWTVKEFGICLIIVEKRSSNIYNIGKEFAKLINH